jgi:hypothetical protein
MSARWVSVLGTCFALGLCANASAQQPAANGDQEAQAKFDLGRDAVKQNDLSRALALFQESFAIKKTAGALINVASCEEKLGRSASAVGHYRQLVELLPESDPHVAVAKERLASLEPHVPALRIRLDKDAPAGTTVSLGEREIPADKLDKDMALDPGTYTISASAAGSETKRYTVVLEDSKKETLVVAPAAIKPTSSASAASAAGTSSVIDSTASAGTAAPGTPQPSKTHPLRVTGIVLLSLAGGSAIVGAVVQGMANRKQQQYTEGCIGGGKMFCGPELEANFIEGNKLADVATGLFVGAGVALAGGLTMVIAAPSIKKGTAQMTLTVGPGNLEVRGRF